MKRFVFAVVLLAISLCASSALAQQDYSKVQIKATLVAGNVYMLEGAGGNIGVSVGADGILIIDDQFAPLAERIRAALKELNPGKLKFILNTHWHGDHTGGNASFGPEAPIVAHTNVRKRLAAGSPKEALPVVTFDQSLSIHFNGEEIRVLHYPRGHTDGDSIIFFATSNVYHMGDDFFAGKFPYVDLASGGDVEGLTANIAEVIAKFSAGAKIIPGHGAISTLDDLKMYHQMLVETTAHIRKQKDAGKDVKQIQTEGLPDKWKDWGTGFVKTNAWIDTVFRSLSQKK